MNESTIKQLWLGLACEPKTSKLIILGMNQNKLIALKEANNRAKGLFYTVINIIQSPDQVYKDLVQWFNQIGVNNEDALSASKMIFQKLHKDLL